MWPKIENRPIYTPESLSVSGAAGRIYFSSLYSSLRFHVMLYFS